MPFTEIVCANRAEWLEQRRQGIGASDAAVILGLTKWKSPMGLYAEKTGLVPMSQEESDILEWGQRLEPVIALKYADETGRVIRDPGNFTIQKSTDVDFQLATLDRVVTGFTVASDVVKDGPGVLELKNVIEFKREDWQDEPPLLYQVQVQHQLAVTGFAWGSIAAIIGGRSFVWQDIPRNERFISLLLQREEEFWRRVVDQRPPAPDDSEATADVIKALYPREQDGQVIAAPAELMPWADQLAAAKLEIKALEVKEREAENHIKAFIGEHLGCVFPNGVAYTLKAQKRASYVVQATEFRVLRRVGEKKK